MNVTFYKYQGTGNDFIMIDNRELFFDADNYALIAKLCERRMGIGADGLILLQNREGYDFEMVYYNADGRPGSMCGNGGRCTVQFARQLNVIQEKAFFLAADGDHYATIDSQGQVSLKMNDVVQVETGTDYYFLNTGSPHYVQFVDALDQFNVFAEGKLIRYNDRFKAEGTNVNFAQLQPEPQLFVRTYERGVEDETFSCGTGVTATALAASYQGATSPVSIRTLGGNLQVAFEATATGFTNIYLIGPAQYVFTGTITV
ncbi:diaminopimelate epimerase [Adhaeribacter pallidiroseus]|uniref:Diaminopimelate epimerase n=1 Tax=Adhaeribacter pallidiroseus TaxID=2072847 RepID=A0A369QN95_9BACT|nr:diaminopimelate epimerase [Adhaeribacter pallidiroseus]RDC64726.1 Diaminopimelate epimerase [Adhaeribacter pallidiroseus]